MSKALRWVAITVVVGRVGRVVTGATAVAERSTPPRRSAKVTGTITVSAAASLTEAFTEDGHRLPEGATRARRSRSTSVRRARWRTQIQGGAPADVFASADGANMQKLVTGGQVTAEPTAFASNLLTIVVKPGNPKGVKSLADLANLGVVSLVRADGAVRQVRRPDPHAGAA